MTYTGPAWPIPTDLMEPLATVFAAARQGIQLDEMTPEHTADADRQAVSVALKGVQQRWWSQYNGEMARLQGELSSATAELKEAVQQRDALHPGEGRVVVDALDAEHFYYLGQRVAIDDLGDLLGVLLVERVESLAAGEVAT